MKIDFNASAPLRPKPNGAIIIKRDQNFASFYNGEEELTGKVDDIKKRPEIFRVLMVGDVMGKAGRDIVVQRTAAIRAKFDVDFVVVNAENAAGGAGLTPEIFNAIIRAGVDCVTLGDHAFDQKSLYPVLNSNETRLVRPANLPPDAPGKGWTILEAPPREGRPALRVAVVAGIGRVFMRELGDNPIVALDKVLEKIADVRIRLLDFHAEATSEAQTVGRYFDGRFSAVLGTHTHVPTADEEIFPNGTAFQCDVGMTGSFESIIGRKLDVVFESMKTCKKTTYEVASKDARLCGTLVDVNPVSGKAVAIRRLVVREDDEL